MMRKIWTAFPILMLAMTLAVVPAVVLGQSQTEQKEQKDKVIQGDLVSVDMEKETFVIKNADGDEWQFKYNANTKVEGAENSIQGLSTKTGTRVSVHYKEQTDQKIATRIEIQK